MMTEREKTLLEEFSQISLFSLPKTPYFEQAEKDASGNYHFIKSGSKEKIQIIFRIAPTGVLAGNKTEYGYDAVILGNKNEKQLADATLYAQDSPVGILRSGKESRWYIEYFSSENDDFPEILTLKTDFLCKGLVLYGGNLDSILSLYFACYLKNNNDFCDKNLDFTVWNASLSGENGLISALQFAKADKILYVSLVKAGDGCSAQKGPAVVLKDGNYILPLDAKKQFEDFATREELELQFFVGKTNRAMEQLDIHGAGKPLLGIYLPVEHENTRMEEMIWSDIEKTQNVLLKYSKTL